MSVDSNVRGSIDLVEKFIILIFLSSFIIPDFSIHCFLFFGFTPGFFQLETFFFPAFGSTSCHTLLPLILSFFRHAVFGINFAYENRLP